MKYYLYTGLAALFCAAVFLPATLRPQPAPSAQRPYVATSKTTIYVAEPGKPETVREITHRIEARDRQGRRYTSPNSNTPAPARFERIRDAVSGRAYEVSRERKVVYLRMLDPVHAGPDSTHPRMPTVEYKGVPCLEGPTRTKGANNTTEVVGSTCFNFDLELLVHVDDRVNVKGQFLHVVTELKDLKLDADPPPEWFQIPPDFRVIEGPAGRPSSEMRP